jgi:hypothetical protein
MMTNSNRYSDNRSVTDRPLATRPLAKIRADKATRRKREIALLLVSLCIVIASVVLREPFLILVSIFPALASFGQR